MENIILTSIKKTELKQLIIEALESQQQKTFTLNNSEPYIASEVMEILQVSKSTLYGLVKRGEIKCSKPSGRLYFKKSDIEEFITKRKGQNA